MNDATQFFDTTASGGYQIERSLRFNSSDSAYLSRTPSSAGNRKTWTWAGWVKRTNLSTNARIWSGGSTTSDTGYFSVDFFNSAIAIAGYNTNFRVTTAVYRDPSAWMHIVVAVDTNQSTADNRIRLYVNGSEVTTFSTNNTFTQGSDTGVNQAQLHLIGGNPFNSANMPDMYLADVHLIDGQQLDPSSFTEVSATTGQLIPKAYTGTYGTNGFHLPFSDNSTAAALGTDTSGNSNTWTVNNISVTAGSGNDSLVDTPTNYGTDTGAGGEVRGNYAAANPLDVTTGNGIILANGNLDLTLANASARGTVGIPSSGKWYFEWTINKFFTDPNGSLGVSGGIVKPGDTAFCGVIPTTNNPYDAGGIYKNGSKVETVTGISLGDVFGVAIDMDNLTLRAYRNGATYGAQITIDSASYLPRFAGNGNYTGDANTASINFGQRPFAYTAPSGFKALCTTNLPDPVVAQPSTVMDVKLYTGNGSTQTISGLGFSPDLVWIKSRSGTYAHVLQDSVRGATAYLVPNLTNAENTNTANDWFREFTSDGFTVAALTTGGTPTNEWNANSSTYAAWTWDAGSSTVTNTQGSITSQVRANASAGFSVATWSGTGSGSVSVGHGLGVAPQFFIVKDRSNARNWMVYHASLGATKGVALNSTNAASGADSGWWNNTAPTSTVATIGTYGNESANYVGYFWAPVAGYSSFGSYTGNGSTDGPFVFCNFRPRFLLVKRSDASGEPWVIHDTARDFYNGYSVELYPNNSNAEGGPYSPPIFDFLSNGFKIRSGTATAVNASGGTFIYMALAESPFQYSRAR